MKRWHLIPALCGMLVLMVLPALAGTAASQQNKALPMATIAVPVSDPDYACTKDSDCVVKDQHNCCGYHPACMNVDAHIDVKAVERACEDNHIASICGFAKISSCSCVKGTCIPTPQTQTPVTAPTKTPMTKQR